MQWSFVNFLYATAIATTHRILLCGANGFFLGHEVFARHHKMAYNFLTRAIERCETTKTLPFSVTDVA
jgi:membrane protein DedA with SNARE-associated domain